MNSFLPCRLPATLDDVSGIIGLILLAFIGAISIWLMWPVQMSGDEFFYTHGARSIANYLHSYLTFDSSAAHELQSGLVQNGWFMPGMALVLSPMYLVFGDEVAIPYLRLYVLFLNLILLHLICVSLAKQASWRAVLVFLSACLAVPHYIAMLSSLWSDLLAVHMAILFLFWLDKRLIDKETTASVHLSALFIAILTYLRAAYVALIPLVMVSWMFKYLDRQYGAAKWAKLLAKNFFILIFVFLGMLSPWSINVSELYGAHYLITSPAARDLVKYGDRDYVEAARQSTKRKSAWFAVHGYVVKRAKKNGTTFRKQLEVDKKEYVVDKLNFWAPENLSKRIRKYLAISDNNRTKFLYANGFLRRFFHSRCEGGSQCLTQELSAGIRKLNASSWSILLFFGLMLFAYPIGVSPSGSYFMPFLWKGMIFFLATPPLFAPLHSRYYAQFVPMIGIALGYLVSCRIYSLPLRSLPRGRDILLALGQALAATFALAIAVLVFIF
jgi:hypothetical protein